MMAFDSTSLARSASRAAARIVELGERVERSWFHRSPLRARIPDRDRMDAKLKRRERALRLFLYLYGAWLRAQESTG